MQSTKIITHIEAENFMQSVKHIIEVKSEVDGNTEIFLSRCKSFSVTMTLFLRVSEKIDSKSRCWR